jgi:hypothetical protein
MDGFFGKTYGMENTLFCIDVELTTYPEDKNTH